MEHDDEDMTPTFRRRDGRNGKDSGGKGGSCNSRGGGVSLEAIKRKVLGRSVPSLYDRPLDVDTEGGGVGDSTPTRTPQSKKMSDQASVSYHLRGDLSCSICHEPFYKPVSLCCGHSFCKGCLAWWSERSSSTNNNGEGEVEVAVTTCPTV